MKIRMQVEVKPEVIENMLVGAFEGGSNYWAVIEKKVPGSPAYTNKYVTERSAISCAMSPGGHVVFSVQGDEDMAGKRFHLNLRKIESGLRVMLREEPTHFADMMAENDDATTADVFLQCCLFQKKSIYG